MCGIAGIYNPNGGVDVHSLKEMTNSLIHRGPDEEGYFVDSEAGIAFGHRRLSIIDLKTGQQPLCNEDQSVWVVLNGEIYNFLELREELEAKGHHFETNSDTEVVVHAYESFGIDCIKHFRGMFAFALWDKNEKKLFLARDRVGKKPLVYTRLSDGTFLFASEIQAILQHRGISREIDFEAVNYFLSYTYIPAPLTIFKGVFKVPPGHYLTYDGNNIQVQPYWQLHYYPKLQISEEDAIETLLELLKESVKIRLISEVPLGAFLSGGVDSSTVVALMSEFTNGPVKTFSIGFEEQDFDELKHARRVSKLFGTDHHEFIVKPKALDILPALVRHYGEPYADSSAIPTYYLSKITREHITVALNGDGGDELFAGYDRYLGFKLSSYLDNMPDFFKKMLAYPIETFFPDSINPKSKLRRIKRFFQGIPLSPIERYFRWISIFREEDKGSLYSEDFKGQIRKTSPITLLEPFFNHNNCLDSIDSLLNTDTHTYLPYDLLVKVDITSMANSLEARSPFLDHVLMEFVARLPSNFKLHGRQSKYLLKKAFNSQLPSENLHRTKMGFGVPIARWFREDLKDFLSENLLSNTCLKRGYFKPERVQKLVHSHIEGEKDNSFHLWTLLMLELWHREFIDKNSF
ncbi:MAG: asparagine synthase (glutamine-hydrolyzing) [Desulfobacterales bacterium]|nr:asparagine synthase (glutamine-hydrolyzing) [Desulfobacterales bacterium]